MTVVRAVVTEDPLDVGDYEALVRSPEAGAVVSFAGVVRNHDHGREVTSLEYVGHPSAQDIVVRVAKTAAERDGVTAVAVAHRLGVLQIGEAALVCTVAAPHRAEAFAACSWLVDEVKRLLPVWKRQVFSDGTDAWVNCP
jgi:molybdopterin synthase catalytic subunit